MPYELLSIYQSLPVFALVVARLAGLVMFQPLLSALAVPVNLRALLIVALAALVTPFVHLPATLPETPAGFVLAMGGEMLLGILMGVALLICFLGLQLGGLLIAQESGLAFGAMVDPTTDDEENVLGVFYLQLAAVTYLILGGHRALVTASLDTFDSMPLMAMRDVSEIGARLIVDALAVGGQVGVRVAAPTVLTLFLVNIALGFISRTVPQLNIITVGFALKALIAFVIMAVSVPTAMTAFTEGLETVVGWVNEIAVS